MVDIVLLNGPSSAGKSTIAREIKNLLDSSGYGSDIVSIDDHMLIAKDEEIWEDDVFEAVPSMCQAIRKSLDAGRIVIADHVITSERIFRAMMDAAEGKVIKLVLVYCDPELLMKRESARGDRFIGSAEASYKYLFPKDGYDMTIDSGNETAKDAAEKIVNFFFGSFNNNTR